MFLDEIENFCDSKGNNTYSSSFGHDDVVMAQMQLVFAKQTIQFKSLLDSISVDGLEVDSDKYYNPYEYHQSINLTPAHTDIDYSQLEEYIQKNNRHRLI